MRFGLADCSVVLIFFRIKLRQPEDPGAVGTLMVGAVLTSTVPCDVKNWNDCDRKTRPGHTRLGGGLPGSPSAAGV